MKPDRLSLMGWWRRADTLALRLFLLIWVALVLSHIAAYSAVRATMPGHGPASASPHRMGTQAHRAGAPPHSAGTRPLPTFPSLPPTPGMPGQGTDNGGPPALPRSLLLLDYGVRLLLIGVAAWWGSRWLARPVTRLVTASQALGPAVVQGYDPALLDVSQGTAEVRAAASVFNRMARQIQHQFRSRALMVAAISHDLRTPLTRMRLRVETVALPPAQRQRFVDDLQDMNALIDAALEVFRATGGAPLLRQRTDVTALVQALLDDRADAGARVQFDAAQTIVLSTDALALRRVVSNLVDNALRYAGHAEVELLLGSADQQLRIRVADRGPGIPPDQLEAVLQPFVRVEASRNASTGGTGLGLFIARELVERLGGELSLHNRTGGGLSAELVLPM